jgi:hypothetical protein
MSERGGESVPIGSPVGRNGPRVPIGCHAQLSDPVGDKYRISSTGLEGARCSGLGKDTEEVVRMRLAGNRGLCVVSMQWR